jgi:hypothetical protein
MSSVECWESWDEKLLFVARSLALLGNIVELKREGCRRHENGLRRWSSLS